MCFLAFSVILEKNDEANLVLSALTELAIKLVKQSQILGFGGSSETALTTA
ncbi:MAG: hypothetical protein LBI11_00570 [Streptococcaceae bacterium]|jgi:hypothetical protein|nr:hypothetical protein [Streptococcaceae bacterium]